MDDKLTLMRILFCDSASHEGMLACVTDDKVSALESVDHRIDDADLISRIKNMLMSVTWSYHDLTHIACVVGPGGFTSLRMSVAMTNALSHELNIPACGIHLSDVYRSRSSSGQYATEAGDWLWLHSTKKNGIFIRGFGSLRKKFPKPVFVAVDDIKMVITTRMQWMGELIPEHLAIVAKTGAEKIHMRPASDVLPDFLARQYYTKQILQPWYGRGW